MALKSNNTALAIVKQPTADTFVNPSTAYMPVSQCRLAIEGVTADNDEYTGTPWKVGSTVAGKRATLSFNVKLRPPGGASPPAADAFLPGLILQAAKFTENRVVTAVPVAAEALSAGSTTGATLGAGATGTVDLYKGLAISLSDNGSTYKARMTAITSYTAAKVATFAELLSAPPAANYQIPKQLAYQLDYTVTDPTLLSMKVWLDGHRFDLMNMRVASLQIVLPTSTKNQAAYPELQCSFTCDINANAAEATPAVTGLGAVPLIKDGDCWLNRVKVGVATATIDMSVQVEFPANPNKVDGVDAGEIVSLQPSVSMTRQKYLPSYLDTLALADAQTSMPFWLQWGSAIGAMVQVVVCDGRLNYQSPDTGGALINETGDLIIDPSTKCISINFPF